MGGGVPMSPRCIVAGPPVHRKIEIEQSLGSANQDDRSGMRDFSYIVRRLGNLLDIGEEGGAQTEIQNLESHVRHLYTSARRANSDPLSKEYPPNADLREKNPPMSAYTDLLGRSGRARVVTPNSLFRDREFYSHSTGKAIWRRNLQAPFGQRLLTTATRRRLATES